MIVMQTDRPGIPGSIPRAVWVLGVTVFCIGTTEIMVVGLLPALSREFEVSIPTAGLLISGFALGVTIGGPVLTAAFLRTVRKNALIALLIVFIMGQVLSALAQSYSMLMGSRILSSLAMGAFFGIGAAVAVEAAGPAVRAKAMAVMFGGLTIANVLGLPAAVLLAQHFGWRASFWAVAILATTCLMGLFRYVPREPRPSGNLRTEVPVFRNGRVWAVLGINALGQAAIFCTFSYLSPLFTEISGFTATKVPLLLLLFGVGCLIGITIGGKYADRYPLGNLYIGITMLMVVLATLSVTANSKAATMIILFLFGVAAFGINPALGAWVMRESGDAPLAASVNTSSFNIGNTIGPWVGGLGLSAGLGYTSPAWLGSILAAACLASVFAVATFSARPTSTIKTGRAG
jgi:DHA1 family inner membrane transport protein